ncbi:MAG: aminotransferase class I/II-fold pyridoxal phosphate-dependent enzyme [Anaeromicrobium sp.]|jgi:arginine/lysine/ornithine decarboxylase|uniref:aminotransferase class I/II-fold pyridoxal phosphate-dependent enzyme n=1 Tax=Anaeromicrobium sp. TaxID=1929132 RepID=UPI0025F43C8B|nr:aminotransferase class I/II-fold pyridoxal phosphate-dependent enzyme [Anaeromicrobium sp.]MCT4592665.1 aminotransferase class I/II-fold pyridoxal phosphate-dependent enzyme [Anaeromicrobium sp.]
MNNIIENKLRSIDRISFHVPGHKYGRIYKKYGISNILDLDTTEIPGTDNLHSPEGIIRESQVRAANFFGADNTFFLVNGTTSGNISALLASLNPGEKVLVPRNCHKSVVSGMIMGGIEPVYMMPKIYRGISMGMDLNTLENKLKEDIQIKAILITNPNYYGICADIEKISEIAHKYGKILIVDEAHGSHLILSEKLPMDALRAGADMVCQSTHKTLMSFTQSSMIHVKGNRVDRDRLKFMLRMNQSTSPSYLLMNSLDTTVSILIEDGKKLIDNLINNLEEFYKKLEHIDIDYFSRKKLSPYNVYDYDLTRIVIDMTKYGIIGTKLEKILYEKYNIQMEMSDTNHIVGVATIGNIKDDFEKLYEALKHIKEVYGKKEIIEEKTLNYNMLPKVILNPRQAAYGQKKSIKLEDSIGHISGEYIIPYPPGIPLLCPGEEISKDLINHIKLLKDNHINLTGIKDKSLMFIQVIEK